MRKFALVTIAAVVALVLAACTPPAGSSESFAYVWYMATDGNDDNNCTDPSTPCATLQEVIDKATAENTRLEGGTEDLGSVYHTVNVAAGTYDVVGLHEGYRFAGVNLNLTVVGAGESSTIFDAADTYGGLYINSTADTIHVTLRNFTIRNVNGSAPDSCVNIRGNSDVTIENVTVSHCVRSGIANFSSQPITLTNVTATNMVTDAGGNGNGFANFATATVNGGRFANNGGPGINSHGTLELNGVTVEGNQRDGVSVGGTVVINDSTIQNNGQDGSFRAGLYITDDGSADVTVNNTHIDANQFGIWQHAGTLRLNDSVLDGNPRTAIIVSAGELRLTDSSVTDNGSFYNGTSLPGALSIEDGARAVIRNSHVDGNRNGAIDNDNELFFIESTLVGNRGSWGTLFNREGSTAIVERSLIADNLGGGDLVLGGVAVENRGVMNMINTTISGNETTGFVNSGSLNLAYSTIAFNGATGFVSSESSTDSPWLLNDLIAGNGTDCYHPSSASAVGALTLAGNNMDTDGTCGFPETTALADLQLDPLADNGGPTMTHALLPGSPALDTASGDCAPSDQRNATRPFGPACDLGAYEGGGVAMTLSDPDFVLPTPTPTGEQPTLIITVDTGCFFGPGEAWLMVNRLKAGTQAAIVGQGYGGGWMVIKHPDKGINCWVQQDKTQFDIPLDQLRLIAIPNKPTPTQQAKEERDTATPDCYYDVPTKTIICR